MKPLKHGKKEMQAINFDELKVTDLAEIKQLLYQLIDLIAKTSEFLATQNLGKFSELELMSYYFSLTTADFKNTLRLGRLLTKMHTDLIEEFKQKLKV